MFNFQLKLKKLNNLKSCQKTRKRMLLLVMINKPPAAEVEAEAGAVEEEEVPRVPMLWLKGMSSRKLILLRKHRRTRQRLLIRQRRSLRGREEGSLRLRKVMLINRLKLLLVL